jgi:DNA mismatch repair protein MSH5
LKYSEQLLLASEGCGDVDAILALALTGQKYNWSIPKMIDDGSILDIRNGRHPLQELVVPSFVPNDCHLGGEVQYYGDEPCQIEPSSMVLTGPNHSGKSVFLKQVGLIVYLAHIGSLVPADRATIGVTDRILTRISTLESVCKEESAFAIDLKQLQYAIMQSTPQSLVLIDEFGRGTNSDDGAGLLTSFLEHIQSLASRAPRVLLTTHLKCILDFHQVSTRKMLRLAHMEVLKEPCEKGGTKYITYLFKLRNGQCSDSFGCYCATLNGVPNLVVERAKLISFLLSHDEDIKIPCAKLSLDEEMKMQLAEDVARTFLRQDFEDCAKEGSLMHDARNTLRNVLSTRTQMGSVLIAT